MTKFVILTTQRSGSTFFWRYLDSHPEVSAHGEVFLNSMKREDCYSVYRRSTLGNRLLHVLSREGSVKNYLQWFFKQYGDVKAAGFKLMYNQLTAYPLLEQWFEEENIHVIHLIRKNILKTIISRKTAEKRNIYHSTEKLNTDKIYIDTKHLISDIEEIKGEIESNRNKIKHNNYIEVFYEDISSNLKKYASETLSFLGINSYEDMNCDLKKINPDSLEDIIENYDEVCQELAGNNYISFLQ